MRQDNFVSSYLMVCLFKTANQMVANEMTQFFCFGWEKKKYRHREWKRVCRTLLILSWSLFLTNCPTNKPIVCSHARNQYDFCTHNNKNKKVTHNDKDHRSMIDKKFRRDFHFSNAVLQWLWYIWWNLLCFLWFFFHITFCFS